MRNVGVPFNIERCEMPVIPALVVVWLEMRVLAMQVASTVGRAVRTTKAGASNRLEHCKFARSLGLPTA